MDYILHNANISTLSSFRPHATAIAVQNGRIVGVGSDSEILASRTTSTKVQNLCGRTVLPGLTDAHVHLDSFVEMMRGVNAETDSLEECLSRVAGKAAGLQPPDTWIVGRGWHQDRWGGALPSAADLDRVCSDHPVYLKATSGHAAWVNSVALKAAGVTANTPDPPGGEISRGANGDPTGILFENAMGLVWRIIPQMFASELADALLPAIEKAWRVGLTGLHDFGGRDVFIALQMLRERGQLGLRVVKQILLGEMEEAIAIGLRTGFGDDWLRIGGIKVFADGALGLRTACMIEGYNGTNNCGIEVMDKDALYGYSTRAAANGLAMVVHAIGDKSVRNTLDVFQIIRHEESLRGQIPLRHRLEHLQLVHPDDTGRLGEMNIIASMQPVFATSDIDIAEKYWGERCDGAYAWLTQLNSGAILAFGSDSPVESMNPFAGIHAAVTRRRADGYPSPGGWRPEQRLTVEQALLAYTRGPAYAAYMENRLGSLTPGKLADLIVIDQDIFTCDPMAIKDTQVLGTMVGGEWKYRTFE